MAKYTADDIAKMRAGNNALPSTSLKPKYTAENVAQMKDLKANESKYNFTQAPKPLQPNIPSSSDLISGKAFQNTQPSTPTPVQPSTFKKVALSVLDGFNKVVKPSMDLISSPLNAGVEWSRGVEQAKQQGEGFGGQLKTGIKEYGKGLAAPFTQEGNQSGTVDYLKVLRPQETKLASKVLENSPNAKTFIKDTVNMLTPADLIPGAQALKLSKLGKVQDIAKAAQSGINAARKLPMIAGKELKPREFVPSGAEVQGGIAKTELPKVKQPVKDIPTTNTKVFADGNIESRPNLQSPVMVGGMNKINQAPSIKQDLTGLVKGIDKSNGNVNTFSGVKNDLKGSSNITNTLPDTTQYIATKTSKTSDGISKNIKKGYTATVDDLYPISEVNKDSYIKAMNTRQVDMIAHRSLTNSLVDKSGKVVSESLKEVTSQIPKGKETAFTDYMINLHAPTWIEQGRKVFPDEAGVTADVARIKAQKYAMENPEFVDLGKRVTQYQQNLAKTWLVDTGIMKAETWKGLVEQYSDYIPFQREFADIEKTTGLNAKRGFVGQSNPLKKATGSQRKIIDPIETIIERTGQYIKTAKRNDVMNPIVDDLIKNPEAYSGIIKMVPPKSATLLPDAILDVNKILQEEGIDGLISKFNKPWESQRFLANKGGAIEKGGNIVTVMRDGAPIHLEVNDMDFLKAITNLNPQQATAITRAVGKVTAMMKTLTTGINPVFGLARNIWRDLATGYINSKTLNANPLGYAQYMWDLMKASGNTIAEPLGNAKFLPETFQSLFKKGGEPMAYFKNIGGGGHVSSISSDRNLLKKAKDSIMPQSNLQKIANIPKKIIGGIETLNNALEVGPRLAEAKRVLKQGGSNDMALFESQDLTTNFSKKGNVTKEADAFIPYLNAAVQGIDKTVRAYNPASSGGKNVANSIAKSIYAITIPTLILYAVNHADDAYNMLSDYQKDNFYNFPKGDGTFTKIPKPREQGVVFGSFPERMMRVFKDNDPEAFTRFADTIKQNFMPPTDWIGQAAQDIWRTPEGRDWRGNTIVNQSMSNLSPKNQYDENTSEPSKFIGDKLNLSPKKIDATAKSYLGGVASLGLPAVTKGKSVMDTLKSQVTVDPAYSNDIMNDFYSNLNKLQKVANDKDFKSGVKGALDRRQTTDEERKVSEMNKFKKQIDDINKKIPLAPTEEKRRLRLQMLDIAKQANSKFK